MRHHGENRVGDAGLGSYNGLFRRNGEGLDSRSGRHEQQESGEHCTHKRQIP